MEKATIYIEEILSGWGAGGEWSVIMSHLILIALAFGLAFIVGLVSRRVIVPIIMKITSKTKNTWDELFLNRRVLDSACRILPAIIIWMFIPAIFYRFPYIEELLSRITAIYITIAATTTAITLTNSLQLLDTDIRSAKHQYLHSFCGVMKIILIFIAVIVIVAILIDRNPTALLTGLGATSAILMLIFQDTIKGLVAGIRLTSNDMIHKGDWISVPKAQVDGIVTEITLTTVKVQNWDNTILTISPQTLVDESFQNWIGMQQSPGRRVKRKVFYDFSSIHPISKEECAIYIKKGYFAAEEIQPGMVNMTLYRKYMEKYLSQQAEVNTDMLLIVRQLEATNAGLPIEFYFFLKDKTWLNYEHNLADIMEKIYAMTPEFGLKIYQIQLTDNR
ncbi:MAG: mechanosensitive ion channel [Prevotella sp.]|nr:mechanosensitive ion channel [Prevotella sp.]